jgi:hypothetical protein
MKAASVMSTMKAAIATGLGDIDENIILYARKIGLDPTLLNQDTSDGWMVIRVLACALAPGDFVRLLSGMTEYMCSYQKVDTPVRDWKRCVQKL